MSWSLVIIFLGITYLVYSLVAFLEDRGGERVDTVREARDNLSTSRLLEEAEEETSNAKGRTRTAWLDGANRMLTAQPVLRRLENELERADLSLRVAEFLLLSGGAGLGLWLIAVFLTGSVSVAVALGLGGVGLPYLFLLTRIARRQAAFDGQLADALTLVSNSLRSGYSLLQALGVAAEEMPEPMAQELRQVLRETRVNIAIEDALANLLSRMESRDLDMVVSAILIQRQVGGNLADVLDQIAATIRERVEIARQIQTLTSQGRLSGWIIGALPFAIGFFLMGVNPGYLSPLLTEPLGRFLLLLAGCMELIGILFIRRLIQLDV